MSEELSRRTLITGALGVATAAAVAQQNSSRKPTQMRNLKTEPGCMATYAAPKLNRIHLGFIGTGARGPSHIDSALAIEGVEVVAVCDTHQPSREKAKKMVTDRGAPEPAVYGNSDLDYRRMLEKESLDAVVISTPWEWHVPMAVDTMNAGLHAFLEVPAAITVDDCWKLVEISEKTQRHCMMMENVNYGREELMVLNLCRQGVLGELLHGEAAYIHDLRWQMNEIEHGTGSWRTLHYTKRNGNLYPTHGLGPVAQYMNINRGDRMEYMSSMGCNSRVRALWAEKNFPEGHDRRKLKFVCGDLNTSIVQTVMGRTIMIQWDEQLPRPYTRHNLIQGTEGCWSGFPGKTAIQGVTESSDSWWQGDKLKAIYDRYDHPLWVKLAQMAAEHGGHGGMDFVMFYRMMQCLKEGLPLDQNVYDAASWSVITPLSEWSVAHRGNSVDVPDFTRGAWKSTAPLGIVQ